jgi:phosphonoacetaldehyde hydrolase
MNEGVKGIIVDWAGTTVDFGCMAPAKAFVEVFRKYGIELTLEEVRGPMGLAKRDHVKTILEYPGVALRWQSIFHRPSTEEDIDNIYRDLEPTMATVAAEFATPIKGSIELLEEMRRLGIKVGSTTGYMEPIMRNLIPAAAKFGFSPDCIVSSSDVHSGRPNPWMCYLNAQRMKIYPMQSMIKIGDTIADLEEGLNAGMWTICLTLSGNEIGLSQEEVESASASEINQKVSAAKNRFMKAGAHFTALGIWECLPIIDLINDKIEYGQRP